MVLDTTGAAFDWACTSARCTPTVRPDTPRIDCGYGDAFTTMTERLVKICPADENGVVLGFDLCRAVVCSQSSDCPVYSNGTYQCRAGLCQRDDLLSTVPFYDEFALCFASIPRPPTCAEALTPDYQVTDDVVLASCVGDVDGGASCVPPPQCRQP